MPCQSRLEWKPWPLLQLAIVAAMLLGSQEADATSIFDPFSVEVSVRISKGERIGDAVKQIFASAKEHDVTELDPARKACGVFEREVRDPDLVLATDLNLDGVRLDLAINLLCEATGGAFLIQDPDEDSSVSKRKFLFFSNSDTAIRDVFYEVPPALRAHFTENVRAAGGIPGPGEGNGYDSVLRVIAIRGGNRYQAVVKKVVADASH